MAIPKPNLHKPAQVLPDGSLSKPLIDWLGSISSDATSADSSTDIAAINDRLDALEESPSAITLYGTNGVSVYEPTPGNFEVRGSGASQDFSAAFLLMGG